MLKERKIIRKNLEIPEKALPLHPVISFSVINYVVSMRGPHVSGDNLFFLCPTASLGAGSSLSLPVPHSWGNGGNFQKY